ncbi:hypothetical protein [Zestomonas carbonaria]|uniref:Uncharacterized protein n=1 Tax=Zestomonas carbonaria TaxID=2762745 RepID=A0A7U7ER04_9GAMM|nr:hypothetical protein [Pseudomonas carbonaria]CAD5109578.1 hypothetical protein PSEWESI4_03884 [Pseudomonas carbonaria]
MSKYAAIASLIAASAFTSSSAPHHYQVKSQSNEKREKKSQ